jgi:hypothetical protein
MNSVEVKVCGRGEKKKHGPIVSVGAASGAKRRVRLSGRR